jgi:hypothetical protein
LSTLILCNFSHTNHKILIPDFVAQQTGKFLHRFSWLENKEIGELAMSWNWLAIEYPMNNDAHLIHYTLVAPCFEDYKDSDISSEWLSTHKNA